MFTRSFQDFLMQIFFPRLSRKVEQAEKNITLYWKLGLIFSLKVKRWNYPCYMSPFFSFFYLRVQVPALEPLILGLREESNH
jgi:hypothetical protein